MKIEIRHVDTCLPDYVLDHCNGENEALIGVPVDRSTRHWQMRQDIDLEIFNCGKLPDSDVLPGPQIAAAIDECFSGAHPLACFDSSLDNASEHGDTCYAWFRITWCDLT